MLMLLFLIFQIFHNLIMFRNNKTYPLKILLILLNYITDYEVGNMFHCSSCIHHRSPQKESSTSRQSKEIHPTRGLKVDLIKSKKLRNVHHSLKIQINRNSRTLVQQPFLQFLVSLNISWD